MSEVDLQAVIRQLEGAAKQPLTKVERELLRNEAVDKLTKLGVHAPTRLVDAALEPPKSSETPAIQLNEPEPWTERVDGAALLSELVALFERFLVLPPGAAVALAVWTIFTHAHDAAQYSPILELSSPIERCGKSTTLKILKHLVARPIPASNLTPASIYRTIETYQPTLVIDEADTFLVDRNDVRGILDSGHDRELAFVVRCVGDDHEPRQFSTWCPKAVALIGSLPRTLEDRSVIIRMKRKLKTEPAEKLDLDKEREALRTLKRKIRRFVQDNIQQLRRARPKIPEELNDRDADNWRILLAIANRAGGPWPKRARKAALALAGVKDAGDESEGVRLLSDLRGIFATPNRLTTQRVLDALYALEGRPWSDRNFGSGMTATELAALLKPFGVRPRSIRVGKQVLRGYSLEDLQDAFDRYVQRV